MDDVLRTAKNCRHYAMCKIDFLESGICSSGMEKHYVSYYPQGRMNLYAALAEKKIPVSTGCIDIADSCDLCGKCDYQCYFVTEMRPSFVMKALKDHVRNYIEEGGQIFKKPDDPLLTEIRKIVGYDWASDDPAITVTYSHDLCPIAPPAMPDYVVLPSTKEEIASLIRLFNKNKIEFTVRGNGSDTMGFAMRNGAIIDVNRMRSIEFDEKNWLVKIGAGVSAFDLQNEASKRGYRVNVAEPAALVCSNIMCSGIFSLFSGIYGTAADNIVNAEFVSNEGEFFNLNEITSPNLFSFKNSDSSSPGVCTSASIKLHPVTDDETGILVPFVSLEGALDFVKNCSVRHIGLAIGILGKEYSSSFFAPTKHMANEVKKVFREILGIPYLVLMIGDQYSVKTVKDLGFPIIDQNLFRIMFLGMPALKSLDSLKLLKELSDDEPFSYLRLERLADIIEAALAPSAALLAGETDPELRTFFEKLFSRPEMSDLVWLNSFRIMSSRMGREKPFVALITYVPIDLTLINDLITRFSDIAGRHNLTNELGFITPLDNGKRCIVEYDYYFDNNSDVEISGMQQAATEAAEMINSMTASTGVVKWMRYVVNQGFCRKESFLYS